MSSRRTSASTPGSWYCDRVETFTERPAPLLNVVTLAERHRLKMEHMRSALVAIDAALTEYARRQGGRFIRFGSTATGRARAHSDVDIIADFPDERASEAATFAETLCYAHELKPDSFPAMYVSRRVMGRALAEGVVLA